MKNRARVFATIPSSDTAPGKVVQQGKGHFKKVDYVFDYLVRPERFELPTPWCVGISPVCK